MLFKELSLPIKENLYHKCKNKKIALPEGGDSRIQTAAKILSDEFQINCILGNNKLTQDLQIQTKKVMEEIAYSKKKTLTPQMEFMSNDPTFAAGAMLYLNQVDAVISGCQNTTAHVIKAALQTVGLNKNSKIITSAFLFSLAQPTPGQEKIILFSDCAVIPKPTSEELCTISYLACRAFQQWTSIIPKVSFLSFSTAGSASHAEVENVKNGVSLFKEKYPEILCDGEVQFDTACAPEISNRKNPASLINGTTNVFIFPDLNSGNIGYKITQYLAKAKAWGPLLLGTAKPFSDLSRGASAEDIAHCAILTLAMAD